MIVEFTVRSHELDQFGRHALSQIENVHEQDVVVYVFSQGYLAATLKPGSVGERIVTLWNRLAYRVNRLFEKKIGKNPEGLDLVSTPEPLPRRPVLKFHIEGFAHDLRQEKSNG